MIKQIKGRWKRAVSSLMALVIAAGLLPGSAFAAEPPDPVHKETAYAPTGSFELNVAGATAWAGGEDALTVYATESGTTQAASIPADVPFVLLEEGETRLKIGYNEGGWTGGALEDTGWVDKADVLVNLPDLLPSIAYVREDAEPQFSSRLTRFEYVIPAPYTEAERLAQLQAEAMDGEETLVLRMEGQTVTITRGVGEPASLEEYSLDGETYQKYNQWTDSSVDSGISAYHLPYEVTRAYSADPSVTLGMFAPQQPQPNRAPANAASSSNGDVGAYNPGSPGGKKPSTTNVAWSINPERTFLRFTLIEFPQGVVTDLGSQNWDAWRVVGTPLNVVWGDGWSGELCRSDIVWYNSNAMQYNTMGADAPSLMGTSIENHGIYSYDASVGHNQRWVATADEFQAETGISDQQKEQMFHLYSDAWSTGWVNGDYTSMWGTEAQPVTPGNVYQVYKANDAFIYLLGRLTETGDGTGGTIPGWSEDEALQKWSEYVQDENGNLRTKYRIIVETGMVLSDPDGVRRGMTLRDMMAYSLYNNEPQERYNLIWDQSSTTVNMSRWMRQAKQQFLEYPLNETGTPTGEELTSTNGFAECDSYVDTIKYARPIRDTIFSERRSFGLHIFSPFNFEVPESDTLSLEVTKQLGENIPTDQDWAFTVTYTAGSPTDFSATKNGADFTDQVTETGSGLKFSLRGGETVHIDFEADPSFRFEVTEDDSSKLTNISGTGGTADLAAKKFTSSGGSAKVVFTNSEPDDPPPPSSGKAILFKRDANTNEGVGPATFKFSSVTNGDYEFDTDENGVLETVQWWDPTEGEGKYIKPGEYTVTELIPPPNYMPSNEVQQIKLELDENGDPIPAGPLVFQNLEKVGLRVVKYDRESHTPMSGVTFEIYRDGASIGRYETDGNGEILLTDIAPGTYRAVEVDTGDESHLLDGSYQEIEIAAGEGVKALIFFNDVKPGMKLVKVDSADPTKTISGAVFEIRAVDGSYGPQQFTTDASGEIDLSSLPTGSYVVTELECEGYVIDNAQRIIHLRANDTAEFVFTNTPKPGFKLIKTSADGSRLEGVTFRIAKIEDGSRYLDRTTDENGEILVSDLEPGIYSVTEIATLPDHILDTTEYHVELSPGRTAELRLKNDKRPSLTIHKADADTDEPIEGVTFIVKAADGSTVTEVTTGPDGTATIEDLLPIVYEVIEKSVPEPYLLDAPSQLITLQPNWDSDIYFENHKKPELTIAKVDAADSTTPIPGTVFRIEGIDSDYQHDVTTGQDGTVTLRVEPGSYRVTELSVPAPYYLPDLDAARTQTISLNAGEEKKLVFKNHKAPELTIYKEDSVAGAPVEGARFHVTYTSTGEAADAPDSFDFGEILTDANGEIKLHELGHRLYPGEYTITEVEPAPGFQMKEPSTQTVVLHGGESRTVTFQNVPLNAVIVEKYDSVTGEALSGATFQLRYLGGTSGTGGTVIGQKVTGKNGTAIWTGLTAGTYILEEIDPADGYSIIQSSETIYLADSGEQSVVTVRFENMPDGILLVRKVCATNPSMTLPNAEFKITYADGTLIGDSNGIYRTDEHGEIRIEGLAPGKSVVVTETQAPPGFIMDTQSQTIQIKEGRTVSLTFKNQPKGELIVQKRDSATGQPLAGAEFRVTTAAGCEVGLDGVIGDSTLTQNGIFETDSNGEICITNLAPGAYVISEIKAPQGYVMDQASTNVVIGEGGDTQTVVITNSKAGTLIIDKRDSLTGEPLEGVTFKVTTSTGEYVPDENGYISSNGIYKTDKDGKIQIDGVVGTLVVTETATIPGYSIDPAHQTQTVQVNPNDTQTIYFENTPSTTLVIEKYIEGTTTPLEGVTFLVTDSSGAVVGPSNGEYITDENGRIIIADLEPGTTVTAREIKTLEGYVLDTAPKSIEIKAGEVQTLRFYNEAKGTLVIRKLDSVTKDPLAGVEFELTYADGGYVDDANGHLSSLGLYTTDQNGEIRISGVTGTIVVKETKTIPGYTIDPATQTQTVTVNPEDTQTLTFYNTPGTTLTIRKYIEGTDYEPLEGVTFLITDSAGTPLGPSNGEYVTDQNGQIVLTDLAPGTTIIARETKTVDGFVLDGTPQSILIKEGEGQYLTFYNQRVGGVEIIKVNADDTKERIPNVTFEIRKIDDELIDTVTTDRNGRVFAALEDGAYYAVEIEAAEGFKLDDTPHYFEVENGKTTVLKVENKAFSGIIIHKVDSVTGEGIYDVKFLLYDADKNPIGEYTTDQNGYIYIDEALAEGKGRFYIRELEAAEGYTLDEEYKTVYVQPGKTIEIEWENVPITGQIQIYKYAAEYNAVTGTQAGAPLEGAVFEIVQERSGKVVDYITTDARGVAASRPLPLGRYKIQEVTAPAYWQVDPTVHDVTLEFAGQIIKLSAFDKPSNLGVTITKRGNAELLAGQTMRYDITVANTSNVDLENFFWHDRIPTDVARATTLTTGTYSARLNYRILYKTNYTADYQVLASNLLTSNNYSFSLNAIPTQAGEVVTDVYFDFGKVPVGFQSVADPTLSVIVSGSTVNGYQLVNRADAGGQYQGTWQTAQASWVTIIRKYTTPPTLPKTGY